MGSVDDTKPEDGESQQTDETESQYNENDLFNDEYQVLKKHIEDDVRKFVQALLSKIDKHVLEFTWTHYSEEDLYDDGHYPGEDGDPADF